MDEVREFSDSSHPSPLCTQFFKRVKKAHTWEVPPLDSKEQEMIESIDEDKMRQQLAQTLLRNKEREFLRTITACQ